MGTVPAKASFQRPSLTTTVAGKVSNAKAPAHTLAEARYLKKLIDEQVPVRLHLIDDQELEGVVEFFDVRFLRLTRQGEPNLFVFKHDIKYICELAP
jgi:host factor-I protein